MISFISGKVKSVHGDIVVIDIGTVGLALRVACPTSFQVDQKTDLHTHMHWNQENGPTLFGFETAVEKQVFLLVIGCSGIGPKIGLAVLRDLGAERFLEAVQIEDDGVLSSVGGLGPKKVEQMIVQLRSKVTTLIKSGVAIQQGVSKDWQNVSDVLTSLNYSRTEIVRAMKFLKKNYAGAPVQFDGLVRHALSFLSKNR